MTAWLWLETLVPDDSSTEISDFLLKARGYYTAHQTLKGFQYFPVASHYWWDGKAVPFKAYGGAPGSKIWMIGAGDPVHVGIADTLKPWKIVPPGFEMDVFEVIRTDNAPTWFIVARNATNKWICLAGDTAEKP